MSKELPPFKLPAGSTIILSTTSPDKRAEYETIFKRFDVNFIFLDDLGLSPQKTDEMTNTYGGNLMQKATEVSKALHENMEAIKDRLGKMGIDTSKPIVGMVEDSGVSFYPKDKKYRDTFKLKFKELIDHKIHHEFDKNPHLRARTFPGMSDDQIDNYLYNTFCNSEWMTNIVSDDPLPGPNYKPIFETLQGGIREIFDTMYEAMRQVAETPEEKQAVDDDRVLRFKNHCSIMLVEPHAQPQGKITAMDIVGGDSKGWIRSQKEMDELFAERAKPKNVALKAGEFFTGDMLIPDGQLDTSNHSQQQLIKEGMLWTKNQKRANYYRLDAAGELLKKYHLPIARKYQYKERVENKDPVDVMVLHGGAQQPKLAGEFIKKLKDQHFDILQMPSQKELLENPNARLMGAADIVFLMPGENSSDMENAQLILGAAVDKQVMPSAKEKTIVVLNPLNKEGAGAFDPALKMLRHAKISGLKNGLSEVNHIVEYDPEAFAGPGGAQALYEQVQEILRQESERKKHRFKANPPIRTDNEITSDQFEPLPQDGTFTIFVAGGAANEYPEFKAPANQLGRFIYDQGWRLVTGAGQKDGPMGAVHSGFVEAYLHQSLSVPDKNEASKKIIKEIKNRREKVRDLVAREITNYANDKHLIGDTATKFHEKIMEAVFSDAPDAEYLASNFPDLLLKLLQPDGESRQFYKAMGSLKERGTMIGYSMPPVLISEGPGKWPMGMIGHHAGNMQRRMYEMLQSSAHVFLAGGQGTYQELVESAKMAIEMNLERKQAGLEPKPICILDQQAYKDGVYDKDGTVFRPVLEAIDEDLKKAGLSREDIGLQTFDSMRHIETHLAEHAKRQAGTDKVVSISAKTARR